MRLTATKFNGIEAYKANEFQSSIFSINRDDFAKNSDLDVYQDSEDRLEYIYDLSYNNLY